ncbi:mucin-binding protein, partial [Lactobacillus johnsonii]|uniref:mucin-binding protein n=1 Tax=Lactobacillus johnsonii TaxID=33959 RepID=UPI003D031831
DTQKVNRKNTVTATIDYKFEDGKTAQPTVTQTKHFSEDGTKDLVTGEITWDEATPQKFEDVATKSIVGYTPDKDNVAGQTVKFGDPDINVTVRYIANAQKAKITYIDDTTKTNLDSKDASGKFGQTITFETAPTAEIANYEKKGYVFVSNTFDNQKYQANDSNNVFYVHLKHGTVTVTTENPQTPNTPINPDPQSPKYPKDISNTNSDVKRTIDYKFKDGKPAQPTVNDSLHFERTVVIDKVTGDVSSDTWTQSQDFNDIQTPAIQGYTPDKTVVSDKNIGHDHQDIIEHVVYSPDAQHMTITYVDDTAGKTLHTDKPDGVSDQDAKYTTSNTIKQYTDLHYKLVSDSTKGQDLIFDHDDNVNQTYYVHFV